MTQIATVEKLIDTDHAEISVPRQSACGHDCADCAGCGVSGGYAVRAVAKNRIQARPGDKVVVESSTKKVLKVVTLVYVLPVVCFFLGYALGGAVLQLSDLYSGLTGVACFLGGLLPAFVYNRYVKKSGTLQYEIVRLF